MDEFSKEHKLPSMIRVNEIAADLGISERTWRDHYKLGKTPNAIRFGNGLFWRRPEYYEWKNHDMPPLEEWEAIKTAKGLKFHH